MRISTRKAITGLSAGILLITGRANAQYAEVMEQMGHLIDDALFYSDQYISPATDAAIYQSVSGWIATPKKKELWDVSLSFHMNMFFTPESDREFTIKNSDLTFFQLEEGTQATVPTALGDDYQVYMSGMLGDSEVRLKTPEGINMERVVYPYLQGSLGLWYGTELVVKYSPKVKLKKSNYQVYGLGIKHNLSQYLPKLAEKKIHLAALVAYSNEDVSFDFLNIDTDYGTLGITTINGIVDTWQLQANVSKELGRFEFMAGFIVNTSDVKYTVGGEKGTIEETIPLQEILNDRLKEIYKTRVNYIGEAGVNFNIGNFSIQSILAFGKFANTNMAIQYSF